MEPTSDITHTSDLAQQLVPGSILALHHTDRMLTLFCVKQGVPHVSVQERFSQREWVMLVALLEAFPCHVSHEHLLALLMHLSFEEGHMLIEQARLQATIRATLGPIRETVKTLRPKLLSFSLEVVAAMGHGYRLSAIDGGNNILLE